jgi:hypothetical protein
MWMNCLSFATKHAAIGEERPARKDKTNLIFYGRGELRSRAVASRGCRIWCYKLS